jgi:RNA polymerase sigma-70 factor (ECF subfamily)
MRNHAAKAPERANPAPEETHSGPELAPGELLELLSDRPELGARALFRTYSGDVNRLVWRLLGADAEHNDLVQQVFFKVIARRHSLREPELLRAWIHSITVNTVYQELRRREVQRLFFSAWRPTNLHGDLVQEMETRDFLVAALSVVGRLSAKQRIVYVLRFLEGRSLPEIADMCGVSLGTVKRRLRGAVARVERLLASSPELSQLLHPERECEGGDR